MERSNYKQKRTLSAGTYKPFPSCNSTQLPVIYKFASSSIIFCLGIIQTGSHISLGWSSCRSFILVKLELESCWFLWKEENRRTQRKSLRPTYDIIIQSSFSQMTKWQVKPLAKHSRSRLQLAGFCYLQCMSCTCMCCVHFNSK